MTDQRKGGIAWTEETWNPLRGCSRVSEGCRNCYAESVAGRFSGPGQPYEGLVRLSAEGKHGRARWNGTVRFVPADIAEALRLRAAAENRTPSSCVREAVEEWLARRSG